MHKHITRILAAAGTLAFSASAAFAHHPMGGATPQTAVDGVLSGIGHPVIGVDHLAFIIAVGVLAAISRAPVWAPLLFVAGTLAGSLFGLAGVVPAINEWLILLSVVALGGTLMAGFQARSLLAFAGAGVAGIFHGMAYAGAVIGAEPTPIVAYLIGFGITQAAIIMAVSALARAVWQDEKLALNARLAGAVIAGVGLTFAVESAEALIFAGVA